MRRQKCPKPSLVESLKHVQAFYLRDLGNPMDEGQANPHKFRILKVLDYDLKYNEDLTEGRLN
jgi:hypothetical protein